MKKYTFLNDRGDKTYIKACTFENAVRLANLFINEPACIGWCSCDG